MNVHAPALTKAQRFDEQTSPFADDVLEGALQRAVGTGRAEFERRRLERRAELEQRLVRPGVVTKNVIERGRNVPKWSG